MEKDAFEKKIRRRRSIWQNPHTTFDQLMMKDEVHFLTPWTLLTATWTLYKRILDRHLVWWSLDPTLGHDHLDSKINSDFRKKT